MTASAFSLGALFPSSALILTAGEPVIGGWRGPNQHYFCPHCYSWIYTMPASLRGMLSVRSAMLDRTGGFRPFIQTFVSESLPWARLPTAHSFERYPAAEQFPSLLTEFAGQGR